MGETALAAAMKAAGVNTDAALLRTIAETDLRRASINARAALTHFTEEIRDAGGIMAQLIPYAVTRDFALTYLEGVVKDMRGVNLVPSKDGDGVRSIDGGHRSHGPIEKSEGGASGYPIDGQECCGSSLSETVPSKDGGEVQVASEGQGSDGFPESREGEAVHECCDSHSCVGPSSSPPDSNGVVHINTGSQSGVGRVVAMPKPPRGLAALQTHARVNSVFDSYHTRQGPVGDLIWSTLPRLASQNAREAALLNLIYQHATPANPNARVRDVLKIEDLQRMIQKAAEIANG